MTLPFFGPGAGSCAPAADRLGRLRKVFGLAGIDPAAGIPHLDFAASARRKPQPLCFPLPLPAKVAIIEKGFENGRGLRAFAPHDRSWIAWSPDALVLPLRLALFYTGQKLGGLTEIPALSVAVVVFSSIAEGPLDAEQRDRIWRAFRVPVFEQLRTGDGAVIARECEVHNGLHVDPQAAEVDLRESELVVRCAEPLDARPQRTGLSADIVRGCCECGAETPRLLNLARMPVAAAARA